MASVTVAAANIVAETHTPETYVNIITRASNLQIKVPFYGQRVAKLGKVFETAHGFLTSLNTYIQLDINESWYDDTANDALSDTGHLLSLLPRGLHPSFRRSNMLLDANSHMLFFEVKNVYGQTFSPRDVARALSFIFASKEIADEFGSISITIDPTDDAVERIIHLDHLSRLKIRLKRPNPDDHEDDEAFYDRKLGDNKAQVMETILIKERKAESLQPDSEIQRMARVAARNGFVEGKGLDESGVTVVESTRSHPKMRKTQLGDDLSISPLDALFKAMSSWKL